MDFGWSFTFLKVGSDSRDLCNRKWWFNWFLFCYCYTNSMVFCPLPANVFFTSLLLSSCLLKFSFFQEEEYVTVLRKPWPTIQMLNWIVVICKFVKRPYTALSTLAHRFQQSQSPREAGHRLIDLEALGGKEFGWPPSLMKLFTGDGQRDSLLQEEDCTFIDIQHRIWAWKCWEPPESRVHSHFECGQDASRSYDSI